MQNIEIALQLNRIEQMLETLCGQQKNMVECLAGINPAADLENGTASTHIPSTSTRRATLTVAELQESLGISRPEAYDLVKQEDFPAFRIGRKILVSRDGLRHWITQQIMSTSARGAA